MPKPRSHPAELALAINGSMFLNITALVDEKTLLRIAAIAPRAAQVFIGVALTPTDARRVRRRLDDASAEAAALVLGTKKETVKEKKPTPKKRKPR